MADGPLELNLGGDDQIANPTAEQVALHLASVPYHVPFVVLSNGQAFIQARAVGKSLLQVEFGNGDVSTQRTRVASLAEATQWFEAFRTGDNAFRRLDGWKPLPWHATSRGLALTVHATTWILLLGLILIVAVPLIVLAGHAWFGWDVPNPFLW